MPIQNPSFNNITWNVAWQITYNQHNIFAIFTELSIGFSIQQSTVVRHCGNIQHPCSGTHYTTLHYTTLHYTTLHYTTLHYTTLHYTTLHCTALHCTALHHKIAENVFFRIFLKHSWNIFVKCFLNIHGKFCCKNCLEICEGNVTHFNFNACAMKNLQAKTLFCSFYNTCVWVFECSKALYTISGSCCCEQYLKWNYRQNWYKQSSRVY